MTFTRNRGGPIQPASLKSYLFLLLLMLAGLVMAPAQAQDDFLDPEDAFRFSVAVSSPTTLDLHYKIAPEYYMYRERFELEAPEGVIQRASYPPGLVKYDPTFEKDMEVYYGQVTVRVELPAQPEPAPSGPLKFAITSQGCADAGLCYPPDTLELQLAWAEGGGWSVQGKGVARTVPEPLSIVIGGNGRPLPGQGATSGGAGSGATDAGQGLNPFDFGDTGLASWLEGAGWFQVVGLCLLLGLMLAFTPCVLPMVPILMAIIAGDAGKGATLSRGRGLSLAAVFVLGMSIVYTVLGVLAGMLGAGLMIWLQTPWVLATFAILLALLGLAMFDVFTLQAPAAMQTVLNGYMNRIPGGRYSGVFVMGMLSALIVGPCVAAPLAGVLLFISQTGDMALGGTALFALAWGSGLPLLLLGASSGAVLPKAGAWMQGVKWAFGILLLATAWWMLNSLLPSGVVVLGWVILAVCSAVMMGAFDALPAGAGPGRHLIKGLGLVLAAWALLMLVGMAGGGRDPFRPLDPYVARGGAQIGSAGAGAAPSPASVTEAVKRRFVQVDSLEALDQIIAQADRPVMLDFYADWCVSCIEMERYTFSNLDVARRLDNFVLVQADVTRNQPEHRELLKRFRLFGPPGIIFFDPQGKELDVRVVGFQNAERFGKALDEVLSRSGAGQVGAEAGQMGAGAGQVGNGAPLGNGAPASSALLLSQQLRGLDGEIGQNAVGAGALERQ